MTEIKTEADVREYLQGEEIDEFPEGRATDYQSLPGNYFIKDGILCYDSGYLGSEGRKAFELKWPTGTTVACDHHWSEPDDDGVSTCEKCGDKDLLKRVCVNKFDVREDGARPIFEWVPR